MSEWDEYNEEDLIEDSLDAKDAWEIGFEQGVKEANNEDFEDDDW